MTDNPYTSPKARPLEGELVASAGAPDKQLNPLPQNALDEYMRPGLSIRGALSRSRLKARLTEDAYEKFRTLCLSRMDQEADLILYRAGLRTAADKNAALLEHIENNEELREQLRDRISDLIEKIADQKFSIALAAETKAMENENDLRARHERGEISDKAFDNLLRLNEITKHDVITKQHEFNDRDLDQMSEMVVVAQRTLLRAVENHS